jgi:hypothetical protein
MNRLFVRMSLFVIGCEGYLLVVSGSAQAQPNSAGGQAAQAHATAQQATNHAMQQHWHDQRVMETSRQLQDFSSGQGGGQRFHQPGAGLQVWRPGDRFRSDDLALEFDRLANVDYRSLSPAERGQFKAACRKFRLAVNHGYVYR